jgi:hypothetical protein
VFTGKFCSPKNIVTTSVKLLRISRYENGKQEFNGK